MASPLVRFARLALGVAFLLPCCAHGAEAGAASAVIQASAPAAAVPAPASAPLVASAPLPVSAPLPASAPAAAGPLPASAPQPASPLLPAWIPDIPPIPALDVINAPRDYIADEFVRMVTGVDRFFGSDRNYQETNDSVLQLDWTRIMGYTGEHKFVLQGRVKVHLPETEKRLHLLIESDPDKNTANASNQVQVGPAPPTTTTPESYGAGLRYEKSGEDRWHFSTDGGVKFAGLNTAPFARMRGSYAVPLDSWRMKLAETLFWFNTTGVGETTQLDFERPVRDPDLFRLTTSATWLNNRQSFDLRQDVALYQTVNERTAMLYQASVLGTGDARMQSHVTDYVLLMLYRHRLHREWMYLEISPQLHFPEARSYTANGMLIFRLEILFDKSR